MKRRKIAKDGWREKFLAAFACGASVSDAASSAGITRARVYAARGEDIAFAAEFDDAAERNADAMEKEARRRAVEGVQEPIVYQGKISGHWIDAQGNRLAEGTPGAKFEPLTVRKYSDVLLIFLLKGRRPDVFGEKVDVTSAGKAITVKVLRGVKMDDL